MRYRHRETVGGYSLIVLYKRHLCTVNKEILITIFLVGDVFQSKKRAKDLKIDPFTTRIFYVTWREEDEDEQKKIFLAIY